MKRGRVSTSEAEKVTSLDVFLACAFDVKAATWFEVKRVTQEDLLVGNSPEVRRCNTDA